VRQQVRTARGTPLGATADAALTALAAAVEGARYAPRPAPVDAEVLQRWVGEVLTDVSGSSRRAPAASAAGRGGGAGSGGDDVAGRDHHGGSEGGPETAPA
jgi:hypothetical protein